MSQDEQLEQQLPNVSSIHPTGFPPIILKMKQISVEDFEEDLGADNNDIDGDWIAFWQGYRGWLHTRGISLYDLRIVNEYMLSERWYPPPQTTSTRYPVCTRLPPASLTPIGRDIRVMIVVHLRRQ